MTKDTHTHTLIHAFTVQLMEYLYLYVPVCFFNEAAQTDKTFGSPSALE
jgi:hypothetical protein